MNRTPVTSSNIASIGYDAGARHLQVEFKHGGVYNYHGVPLEAHESLVKADSIGKHFLQHIRPHYQHTKE